MPDSTTAPEPLDWLVFAEDWGSHPSTSQHLVAHLPASDRVIWVDSLGMRSPRLSAVDVARIIGRLRNALGPAVRSVGSGAPVGPVSLGERSPDVVTRPPFLPWHDQPSCRALNRRLLGAWLARRRASLGMTRFVLLTANPVVAYYLDVLRPSLVVYLRLDDFGALPGVDRELIAHSESELIPRADLVIAPNDSLLPSHARRGALLPQGVDVERFAAVPLVPPDTRTIGYWGLIESWLDYELIAQVARDAPDWTFELRGPVRVASTGPLRSLPNVHLLEPVPHHRLAEVATHWRGAWAPYLPGGHLSQASPLKLREYLAAGFPTACTTIPEGRVLADVTLIEGSAQALHWLASEVAHDTPALRLARRQRQQEAGWQRRVQTLRQLVLATLSET